MRGRPGSSVAAALLSLSAIGLCGSPAGAKDAAGRDRRGPAPASQAKPSSAALTLLACKTKILTPDQKRACCSRHSELRDRCGIAGT